MTNDRDFFLLEGLNFNFGRKSRWRIKDIRSITKGIYGLRKKFNPRKRTIGPDAIAGQELRERLKPLFKPLYRVNQPDQPNHSAGSEAVLIRRGRGTRVVDRGSILASPNTFGQQINQRRFVWTGIKNKRAFGDKKVAIISVHMPPRRMNKSGIDEAYYTRFVELTKSLERAGYLWVAIGDWNDKTENPQNVKRRTGGTWVGNRIDRALIGPGLKHKWVTEVFDKSRGDNHPLLRVAITLKGK